MLDKQDALNLLNEKMQNQNLRKHCYAVGAVMRALAEKFGEDADKWEIVGILHDGDYEQTKDAPEKHTLLMHQWLKAAGVEDQEILNAILSHNYAHTGQTAPSNKMEWALYCCDELTGLIIAVTLVRPDPPSHKASEGQGKKLKYVTVENIMKKWNEKSFAAGVDRKQIEQCEEKLGVELGEFIGIALSAMQGIHEELGL